MTVDREKVEKNARKLLKWRNQFNNLRGLCAANGLSLDKKLKILDFGCGEGVLVALLRQFGYDAWSYDVTPRLSGRARQLAPFYRLQPEAIDKNFNIVGVRNYRVGNRYELPFATGEFDLVVSFQTLEHVFNLDATFSELARITRPGGFGLHVYPPKQCFLEGHVNVPLGHRIHKKAWFYLWALLGWTSKERTELNARQRARHGYYYVANATNYKTNSQMLASAAKYFSRARINPWRQTANHVLAMYDKLFTRSVTLALWR